MNNKTALLNIVAEYRAILFSVLISFAAFILFALVIVFIKSIDTTGMVEDDHRVVQSVLTGENILLHGKSFVVRGLPLAQGVGLPMAMHEEFATEECLVVASNAAIELKQEWLPQGNVTVFDDDWYEEISKVAGFQYTLFAEGYFGIYRVSRPCYNAERNKAILYLEKDCGPDCGNGAVHLLLLKDGQWQRIDQKIIWMK